MRHVVCLVITLLTASNACAQTIRATWVESAHVTPSSWASISSQKISPRTVLSKRFQTSPTSIDFGLPPGVKINAIAIDGVDFLVVPDRAFTLAGLTLTPRDIARRTPAGAWLLLDDWSSAALPMNAKIDAIALSDSGLVYSIDTYGKIGSLNVGRSDLLHWNGTTTEVLYTAAELGLRKSSNIVGLELFENGNLIVVLDASGRVADFDVRKGVAFEYHTATQTWSSASPRLAFHLQGAFVVNSIAVEGDPTVIFRSGTEAFEE